MEISEAEKEKQAGNLAYQKGQNQKAIDHYTKAISLDNNNHSCYSNRAQVYI
jgi:Flp pilus assembly protein TadD